MALAVVEALFRGPLLDIVLLAAVVVLVPSGLFAWVVCVRLYGLFIVVADVSLREFKLVVVSVEFAALVWVCVELLDTVDVSLIVVFCISVELFKVEFGPTVEVSISVELFTVELLEDVAVSVVVSFGFAAWRLNLSIFAASEAPNID